MSFHLYIYLIFLLVELYNKILKKSGVIHLKTDNQFLHAYTLGILDGQSHSIEYSSNEGVDWEVVFTDDFDDIPIVYWAETTSRTYDWTVPDSTV